jgi:hypothetical protein
MPTGPATGGLHAHALDLLTGIANRAGAAGMALRYMLGLRPGRPSGCIAAAGH